MIFIYVMRSTQTKQTLLERYMLFFPITFHAEFRKSLISPILTESTAWRRIMMKVRQLETFCPSLKALESGPATAKIQDNFQRSQKKQEKQATKQFT